MLQYSFEGTGNRVEAMPSIMTGFHIFNTGTTSLTFTVGANTFTVPSMIAFDDDSMPAFTSVTITAAGTWLAYAESGGQSLSSGPASEVIMDARLLLNDMGKVRWSDWEMLRYLNSVCRMLARSIAKWSSNLFVKQATLVMVNGKCALPVDFISETGVYDLDYNPQSKTTHIEVYSEEYKLTGGNLYSNETAVIVEYKYSLPVLTMADTILFPPDFYDGMVAGLAALASGKAGDVSVLLDSLAAEVCPRLQNATPLSVPYWTPQGRINSDYGNKPE